jgi:SAM-dependent methyltransferase
MYVRQALGPGDGGVCLDVACGTGLRAQAVRDAGWSPVGFDISADQLRVARHRLGGVARADARFLPVRDESVTVALGAYFHTDVEDFASVVVDIARCLRPRGRFVYVGLHPCFIGPFVDRTNEGSEEALTFTTGYGANGWARRGSGDGTGTWARVGGHHKTLATFPRGLHQSATHGSGYARTLRGRGRAPAKLGRHRREERPVAGFLREEVESERTTVQVTERNRNILCQPGRRSLENSVGHSCVGWSSPKRKAGWGR